MALNLPQPLAKNPGLAPKYTVKIKNKAGEEVSVADPKVTRGLVALMNMHAVIGGAACHWGGPAAFAEINACLHQLMFQKSPWYDSYNFINDAGHAENGLYALRANLGFDNLNFESLRGFRSISSKLTGHGESHLNPAGVLVSNGPLGSSISVAQGLALGDKFNGKKRTTICLISDGASMEGEAKEAFAAIPGLANKKKLNPFVLVVSDNNTKLSGRIDDDAFSMKPTFESLNSLGWQVLELNDGHDLQATYLKLEEAIELAEANPKKPIAIWAKTIKGKGVKSTEESASGGHGYPLKKHDEKLLSFLEEIFEENPVPEELVTWAKELMEKPTVSAGGDKAPVEKVQVGVATALKRAASEGLPIYSISSDLQGSTGVASFQKEYKDNYTDVGVAEANMLSTGAGCSKAGLIPIVDTFSQFAVTKGNLPLTMANLSQAPVIAILSHTGFQDAADGASHQATTYFAAVSAIPNTTVVTLSCSKDAEEYVYQGIQQFKAAREKDGHGDSIIFFLGRENYPHEFVPGLTYDWGKAQVLVDHDSADVTIAAVGPMVPKALAAAQYFEEKGKKAIVVNNAFVNRPDTTTLGGCLKKSKGKLITLEDHQVIGGMGALLTHALLQEGYSFQAQSLGIPGVFGQSAYLSDHLYEKYGLNAAGVWKAYQKWQ